MYLKHWLRRHTYNNIFHRSNANPYLASSLLRQNSTIFRLWLSTHLLDNCHLHSNTTNVHLLSSTVLAVLPEPMLRRHPHNFHQSMYLKHWLRQHTYNSIFRLSSASLHLTYSRKSQNNTISR